MWTRSERNSRGWPLGFLASRLTPEQALRLGTSEEALTLFETGSREWQARLRWRAEEACGNVVRSRPTVGLASAGRIEPAGKIRRSGLARGVTAAPSCRQEGSHEETCDGGGTHSGNGGGVGAGTDAA